jgi:hypothetical protein
LYGRKIDIRYFGLPYIHESIHPCDIKRHLCPSRLAAAATTWEANFSGASKFFSLLYSYAGGHPLSRPTGPATALQQKTFTKDGCCSWSLHGPRPRPLQNYNRHGTRRQVKSVLFCWGPKFWPALIKIIFWIILNRVRSVISVWNLNARWDEEDKR